MTRHTHDSPTQIVPIPIDPHVFHIFKMHDNTYICLSLLLFFIKFYYRELNQETEMKELADIGTYCFTNNFTHYTVVENMFQKTTTQS